MTREEAIDRLMWLKGVPHINDDKWIEAIDLAIESLSAEPSGDLISRKTLIGAIEKCGEDKIYPQALIEVIKALPSADRPKGRKILDTTA